MDYYQILGFVTAGLILILGFFTKLYHDMKKNTVESQKPLQELNLNIVQLTTEIKHMVKSDDIRDKRITEHGKEIDKLHDDVREIDKRVTVIERNQT